MDEKSAEKITNLPQDNEATYDGLEAPTKADGFGSSGLDQIEMARMGKDQELNRVFHQWSLISFTAILMGTWQWQLLANTQGLTDGGRAGLFWSYIWTFVGYAFLGASLADMASMAPTAGGQYHWVSEFAPRKYQRSLSYASGWLSVLCWQGGNASGLFLCGNLVQSMISIKNPNYAAPAWQGWLLVVACTVLVSSFNIWLPKILPKLESTFAPVYVALLIATVIVLGAMGPHVDGHAAILEFDDGGDWSSVGLATMIGQITAVFALGGSDAAAHMSEECASAGLSVPRTMFWTVIANGLMGFIALIAFIFSCPSVSDALNDPSGLPLVYILNLRINTSGTVAFLALNWIVLMVSNVGYQAAVSRQTFAFGRDGGLPFSKWVGHVNPNRAIPLNAIILSASITILLCLINLGSSEAFNAILSLSAIAQMATYSISITCVLWRRITAPQTLPVARWTLGRWGIPINTAGALYSWFVFFWGFWPVAQPVTVGNFNYAVVMFSGVVILSLTYYILGAKKLYAGPVTQTQGYSAEQS